MFKRSFLLFFVLLLFLCGTSFNAKAKERQAYSDISKYHTWTFTMPCEVASLRDITVELHSSDGKVSLPGRMYNREDNLLTVFSPNSGYDNKLRYKLKVSVMNASKIEELFTINFTIEGYVPMNLLDDLLNTNKDLFPKSILDDPSKYGIQVLYTEVSRDESGIPSFESYEYNVDQSRYFYPASSIKLSACILALDKLNSLNIAGVDKDSIMTTVSSIDTEITKTRSISSYISSILLYSSNTAFNRLFDFLGYQYYNYTLQNHNFNNTKIQHKLSIDDFDSGSHDFNPVYFYDDNEHSLYTSISDKYNYKFDNNGMNNLTIGNKIFKYKNSSSVYDLQNMMKVVFFNDYLNDIQKFNLTDSDIELLKNSLNATEHKYLISGGDGSELPTGVHMYNKYGQAYGHFIDNAYIKDDTTGKEFLLTAVIYANENNSLDGTYEYSSVSLPFLKNLGKVILEYSRR